ncbi:hypothetical protein, partial [Phocaeicola vulgatus]|uniref:hypothetical protein n=2 Tax=Phocaeicola vulgatus TaxID=821 RepID=UPI001C6FE41B
PMVAQFSIGILAHFSISIYNIVFKGNVYFDEREQNRLVFKGRLRWIFQMLIVGNHHLSMMQHRNMFNYQRFSILIGTNKFLTKNSFSMYKCKPLFFSFLLILFVQPFFIQILYISKRLVSGFSRLASFLLSI